MTTSYCGSAVTRGGSANLISRANEALVGVKCCHKSVSSAGTDAEVCQHRIKSQNRENHLRRASAHTAPPSHFHAAYLVSQ